MKRRWHRGALVALAASILLSSCCVAPPRPERETPTIVATEEHRPASPTPRRTATPTSTQVSIPSETPRATQTLSPVQTLAPSLTPVGRRAQVVRVVDGDTIIVSIDGQKCRVRYIGIDCPEIAHSGKPREWMAREASEANEKLVGGGIVYLERDVSDTDRYGRLLRYVWAGGKMVNAELVRLGYAHAITYPPDVKRQDLLRAMQREAQDAQRGLWGEIPTETAPAKAAAGLSLSQDDAPVRPGRTMWRCSVNQS